METLQEKVNRLELELELNQAKQELEDSKPKVGDICKFKISQYDEWIIGKLCNLEEGKYWDYYDLYYFCEPLPTELQEQLRPYLDSFVLPEKWCVKHSKETLEWIKNNAEYNRDWITAKKYYMYPCDEGGNNWADSLPKDYTEITLEQFKRYILNGTNR